MDSTASSFTARNNTKRAAEKMIANGKAPAVNYGIRRRDDGRFEIVWKTAPTTGEVEAEIGTAATAAEDGHYSANPRFSVNEDPSEWPDGTRVMVRNKPKSWSEATIYTRLDAEYWRVQYPSGGTGKCSRKLTFGPTTRSAMRRQLRSAGVPKRRHRTSRRGRDMRSTPRR